MDNDQSLSPTLLKMLQKGPRGLRGRNGLRQSMNLMRATWRVWKWRYAHPKNCGIEWKSGDVVFGYVFFARVLFFKCGMFLVVCIDSVTTTHTIMTCMVHSTYTAGRRSHE